MSSGSICKAVYFRQKKVPGDIVITTTVHFDSGAYDVPGMYVCMVINRLYFQHAHFMLILGVGKRGATCPAPVWNYLEVYWPCAGGLSAVNAIGTQIA